MPSDLDFLRNFTTAGRTTIFVNLLGSTAAKEVPDIWYHVRKSIGDIRHTLPAGIVGPGFNDDFGDTFGIIYGFTADGFMASLWQAIAIILAVSFISLGVRLGQRACAKRKAPRCGPHFRCALQPDNCAR